MTWLAVHAKTSAPARTFTRHSPLNAKQLCLCDAIRKLPIVYLLTVEEASVPNISRHAAARRCECVRLLLAADVPNCSRATTGRPFMFWSIRDLQLSNAIMLVCEATHVYTVASKQTGRVSPEMLLPRAKPAPRCLADGICEHALARGASCPLQKRAQPPKLKPGDTRIRGGLTMSFIISVVYDDSVQSLSRLYHSDSSKFSADGATTDRVHVHLSATASACDHHLVADA